MTPAMQRTAWLMLAIALLVIGYDVWTALNYGTDSTVSWTFYAMCKAYPGLAFVAGGLFGHLLFSQRGIGSSRYAPLADDAIALIRRLQHGPLPYEVLPEVDRLTVAAAAIDRGAA